MKGHEGPGAKILAFEKSRDDLDKKKELAAMIEDLSHKVQAILERTGADALDEQKRSSFTHSAQALHNLRDSLFSRGIADIGYDDFKQRLEAARTLVESYFPSDTFLFNKDEPQER